MVDNAGFFSPDAVSKANQQFADIEQRRANSFASRRMRSSQRTARSVFAAEAATTFTTQWATRLAQNEGITGAFVS